MKSKIVLLTVIILGILTAFGLARNLYAIYLSTHIQDDAVRKLERLRAENTALQAEKAEATGQNFIEREARERLGLVKPGEVVVILPEKSAVTPTAEAADQTKPVRPVWQQWLSLFFGG